MAYIIRSNVVVDDDSFPSYSEWGWAHPDLARYMIDLSARGYVLTETEFDAFSTFIQSLVSAGIYSSLREIYPLFGASADGAAVKLRALRDSIMTPGYGLDDSHFEMSGGRVIGKAPWDYMSSDPPRFYTGLTADDLLPGAGFHALAGDVAPSGGTAIQGMMGTHILDDLHVVAFGYRASEHSYRQRFFGPLIGNTPFVSPGSLAVHGIEWRPNPGAVGVSTAATIFANGEVESSSGYTLINDHAADAEVSLFCVNGYGSRNGGNSFTGRMRFACITDGSLTDQGVSILHDSIQVLCTKLGKV